MPKTAFLGGRNEGASCADAEVAAAASSSEESSASAYCARAMRLLTCFLLPLTTALLSGRVHHGHTQPHGLASSRRITGVVHVIGPQHHPGRRTAPTVHAWDGSKGGVTSSNELPPR